MTKDIHVSFDKVCLDTDHNSVQMVVKELEGEDIVLHFSKSPRVELLHQIQNNLYNTRQEYKSFLKQLKKEEEQRELSMRREINEAMQKDMQQELRRVQEAALKKKASLGMVK